MGNERLSIVQRWLAALPALCAELADIPDFREGIGVMREWLTERDLDLMEVETALDDVDDAMGWGAA